MSMDIPDVIECAASLVDSGHEVSEEYRRGVVELAAELCYPGIPDATTVMGYAVCGVNRPAHCDCGPDDCGMYENCAVGVITERTP